MEYATQDALTETRKLYERLWNNSTPSKAIGDSLTLLAATLNHPLGPKALVGQNSGTGGPDPSASGPSIFPRRDGVPILPRTGLAPRFRINR